MMTVKEKWTGKLIVDAQAGVLQFGNKMIAFDEIEDIAFCPDTSVRFGNREVDKGEKSVLLCLQVKSPVLQPGRIGLRKSKNLLFRLENEEDARQFVGAMPCGEHFSDWNNENFPIEKCIVEAKRGCCDYIRGGIPGARPYGKAGLVAPIITLKLNLSSHQAVIHYVGTNGYHQESAWFSAHPDDVFEFKSADHVVYTMTVHAGWCTVSAVYQCKFIEKDENATGLWYVEFEAEFDNMCDGARWMKMLQGGDTEAEACAKEDSRKSEGKMVRDDKAQLLLALELLHDAGVLTDEEWITKKQLCITRCVCE